MGIEATYLKGTFSYIVNAPNGSPRENLGKYLIIPLKERGRGNERKSIPYEDKLVLRYFWAQSWDMGFFN